MVDRQQDDVQYKVKEVDRQQDELKGVLLVVEQPVSPEQQRARFGRRKEAEWQEVEMGGMASKVPQWDD
jgi:hypothetical protein